MEGELKGRREGKDEWSAAPEAAAAGALTSERPAFVLVVVLRVPTSTAETTVCDPRRFARRRGEAASGDGLPRPPLPNAAAACLDLNGPAWRPLMLPRRTPLMPAGAPASTRPC